MVIERNPTTRLWILRHDAVVLYSGRRSPWDDPSILRDALARERALRSRPERRREAQEALVQ